MMWSNWTSIFPSLLIYPSSLASSWHGNNGVLQFVNPRIGTYGVTPNGNGGMIPSVSPPFGMTRWTPQTRYRASVHGILKMLLIFAGKTSSVSARTTI